MKTEVLKIQALLTLLRTPLTDRAKERVVKQVGANGAGIGHQAGAIELEALDAGQAVGARGAVLAGGWEIHSSS